jgi:hypothetical protein
VWGTTRASGTGTFSENTCQPTCASSTIFATSPGSVYVLNPANGFFQEVVVTAPAAPGLRGPLTNYYPGTGWGSA